jgi:hypothetical protein
MGDPRVNDPAWTSNFSSDEHPMGIQGTHFTVVTSDREAATGNLVDNFSGEVVHESNRTVHGTQSSFVGLGRDVVLEVAEPLDEQSQAGRDLAAGGRFHAVTLRVRELGPALQYLQSRQVGAHQVGPGHAVLDRADTHGVLFRLSDRPLSEW